VHGDIDPDAANYFLASQAGRDGELAKLGVDGIIVANEMQLVPKPDRNGSWFIPRRKVASITGEVEHLRRFGRFSLWIQGLTSNLQVRR
jgi:hypothetical protein